MVKIGNVMVYPELNMNMVLTTQRAIITPIKLGDINEILEMYSEPDSFKYIAPHKDKSIEYYSNFLNGKIETNRIQVGFWTVRDKVTNELIGTVNLNNFVLLHIDHIGCHLKTKYWNKGYAKELCAELIAYGFGQRNLMELHGIVQEGNLVSAKLMKSLKFEFKETMKIEDSMLNIYWLKK